MERGAILRSYPMRLLYREAGSYPERPGDFWWKNVGWKEGSQSAHIVIAFPPRPGLRSCYELHWGPVSTDGGESTDDRWWNGDWDHPTIAKSWGVDHFHGFVIDGILTLDP